MRTKRKTKSVPDDVDKYVGKRLQLRRSLLGLSQEKLGNSIGITFQQIQKYEKGLNRISSGRLYKFSKILDVPVQYFFEGFEDPRKKYKAAGNKNISSFDIDSPEFQKLARCYFALPDRRLRTDLTLFINKINDAFERQVNERNTAT